MQREIAITALGALAQGTRLDIFRLLVQAGDEGMPVGKLGETLAVPNATLSFHLDQLKRADLVATSKKGTTITCKANYGAMNGLIAYLTENCCQGADSECAPATACCPAG